VTNRQRHWHFVHNELLPAWDLCHVATWTWLKVTDGCLPVSSLHSLHRHPYELLLLCIKTSEPGSPSRPDALGLSGNHSGVELQDGLVIVATPAQHSRKPKLGALLAPLLPSGARCLEVNGVACMAQFVVPVRMKPCMHQAMHDHRCSVPAAVVCP
jgi:hypothetical protein